MEINKNEFDEKPKSSLTKVLDIISTMASKPSGFIGLAILVFHVTLAITCLLYTSPSPRDGLLSRMPSSA